MLSFITYSLAGNELNPAIIFSTLQLFNVIRQPLVMLPMAFTVCSDAYVGIKRITTAMLAEELPDDLQIDPSLPSAIRAHGDFIWETSGPISGLMGGGSARGGRDWAGEKKKKQAAKQAKADKKKNKKGTDTPDSPLDEEKKDAIRDEDKPPFSLQGIDIEIARGSLTCIVGSVGSGKVRKRFDQQPTCKLALTRSPVLTVIAPPRSDRGDEANQGRRRLRRNHVLCASHCLSCSPSLVR